jgi:hypothetical protein
MASEVVWLCAVRRGEGGLSCCILGVVVKLNVGN